MSKSEVEELRKLFLNDLSSKGNDSVHPKDLERVKSDDGWLRRFLLHQENDVQNALNMLWTSVNWRKDNNVNDINENTVKMDILCSGAFFPHGTDIDGCTLLIFKCKRSTKGVDANEIRRCVIYWFERLERQNKGEKITIFFDMEGCGLSNMDMDFIKYLIGLFKEYYPYFLNYIIIFEMPWVLTAAFKIVKSWLPEKAIEKIKFLSKKDITTYVPQEQALQCWGGDNDYTFNFIPEAVPEKEKSVATAIAPNNYKKVHFVDGSMSEVSTNSVEKDSDGCSLKVTPSGIITFVKDGNELVSTLELHNTDPTSHISYKLKTTSPEKFRVKPSTGCLAPGDNVSVTVTLLPGFQLGGLSRDKFLVMSTQVEDSELANLDLSELWKSTSNRKVNQHRLKCIQSGEVVKNGNPVPVATVREADQNNYNKLSASIAQLNSCQVELHRNMKVTQYYQLATIFLVILLSIFISYLLNSNLKEISSNNYHCRDASHP